jgi:hypothetical protein
MYQSKAERARNPVLNPIVGRLHEALQRSRFGNACARIGSEARFGGKLWETKPMGRNYDILEGEYV